MAEENKSFSDRLFSDKTALITALASFVVLLVSLIVFLIFGSWKLSWILDEQIVANYGDFVGGVVGTLLAFTAAILYYVALREQRKDVQNNQKSLSLQTQALEHQIDEFKYQREELEETRKVYERQTNLMELQSRIMKQQQFESSFYSMLKVYLDYKNQMNLKVQDCFHIWLDDIEHRLSPQFAEKTIFDRHNDIMSSFEELYLENRDILSPYFKTVYRVLSLIDNTHNLSEKERIQYVKIFRAQLGESETKILYYNYHSDISGAACNGISIFLNYFRDHVERFNEKLISEQKIANNDMVKVYFANYKQLLKES